MSVLNGLLLRVFLRRENTEKTGAFTHFH